MLLLSRHLFRKWQRRTGAANPLGAADRMNPAAAARGPFALLAHQARYDLLASVRNPRARFFTFMLPILMLVILAGVFGNGHTTIYGTTVQLSRFYVGGIMAMSIITATYAGLVVAITAARESGALKRRRATPVPPAILIGGQAVSTLITAAVMSTLLLAIARAGYGVAFSIGALAAMALTVALGTVTFACLAFAVAGLIGSPDAAQPVVQATMLPLYFISSIWIPPANLSSALRHVAEVFPVEHLAAALHLASVRSSFTTALAPRDLLVLALWAVAATIFAARRFSWLPVAASR